MQAMTRLYVNCLGLVALWCTRCSGMLAFCCYAPQHDCGGCDGLAPFASVSAARSQSNDCQRLANASIAEALCSIKLHWLAVSESE
eukprot:s225_g39.t1